MRDEILKSLEEQAKLLEFEAKKLRRKAKERRFVLKKEQEFKRLINNISGDVDPIAYAAEHNLPLNTVRSWHKKALEKRKAAALERRDREIRRLAGIGKTNGELAEKFGLHPKSVGRIVNRARLELIPRRPIQVPYWKYQHHQED